MGTVIQSLDGVGVEDGCVHERCHLLVPPDYCEGLRLACEDVQHSAGADDTADRQKALAQGGTHECQLAFLRGPARRLTSAFPANGW